MKLKLSQEAVDDLLHIIEHYDRERGIPHDYRELERVFKSVEAEAIISPADSSAQIFILSPKKPAV